MLDGRFDPEFNRALAEGQVSASDLAREHEEIIVDPSLLRNWLVAIVTVIGVCLMQLT